MACTTAQQEELRRACPGEWVQRVTIKTRPCYAAQISITGARPYIICTQNTGDALCFQAPGGAQVLRSGGMKGSGEAETGVQQLLQAHMPCTSVPVAKQQLFRFHSSRILFITSLNNSGELLTVDLVGCIAVWPPPQSSRSGLGWVEPRKVMQLQKSMLVPQLGQELSESAGAEPPQPCMWTLVTRLRHSVAEHWTRKRALALTSVPCVVGGTGDRQPVWMVMYEMEHKDQLLRHVIHRCSTVSSGQELPRSLAVVKTYSCASGELVSKRAFHVKNVHVPSRIVAAAMSPGHEMLVVATLVSAAEDATTPWGAYFRFCSISCSSWKTLLPSIYVPDWSFGMVAPVFSIRWAPATALCKPFAF